MDDIINKLIVERTDLIGTKYPWAMDVYFHLIGHGVKHDDAIGAMTSFIDRAAAMKVMKAEA